MIDLTPAEHEHSEAVIVAAQWLADQNPTPMPLIPILRSRFDLTAPQACKASAMAQRFRRTRRAYG